MIDFSGRILGPYRLRQRVGDGGYSTVYRAEHIHDGYVVAVKILNPRSDGATVERFLREIELTRVLFEQDGNRHVIQVFDHGDDDGLRWYAMEFLEGHNLREVLRRTSNEGLRWEVAAFILQNICYAVARMHDRDVIHRDLKPDNIILERTATGQIWIKIIDLGIAKEISVESRGKYPTRPNEIPGTGPYIAPERFTQGLCTAATDQYSLGVMLYECVHGKLPFVETDHLPTLAAQALMPREEIPWRRGPRVLKNIVFRAMATECDMRFPTVQDMGQALCMCLRAAATEHVNGQEETLRLLDRLQRERPAPSAAQPPKSDEKTARLLADRLIAERALQQVEQLASLRELLEQRIADELRQAEALRDRDRQAADREAQDAARAPTRETEVPQTFLTRHGRLLRKILTRTMTASMVLIAGMTTCIADRQWTSVQVWLTRVPEPSTPEAEALHPPVEASKAAQRPSAPQPAPADRESPPAPPSEPQGTPESGHKLSAVGQNTEQREQPPALEPPPRRAPFTPDVRMPPRESVSFGPKGSPQVGDEPKARPDPIEDLMPVPNARQKEPLPPPTGEQLKKKAQRQAAAVIKEVCSLPSESGEASARVCFTLPLDRAGKLVGEVATVSHWDAPAGLDDVAKKCVFRVAKNKISLGPIPSGVSVSPCFELLRKQ